MASLTASSAPEVLRRVLHLQVLTIIWMSAEAVIALTAAWSARSPALMGFGGDSAVELFSALIVLWRFRSKTDPARAERITARIAGYLLCLVGLYVIITSVSALLGRAQPQPSIVGIVLLIAAAVGMPWLAAQKQKVAAQISSASLKADAAESFVCGYLSWIALAGLVVNTVFGKSWADPVAALVLVPFVMKEAWEAMRASRAGCQSCCLITSDSDKRHLLKDNSGTSLSEKRTGH